MGTYEKNKEHIKKWRANHREQYNEISRQYMRAKYVSKFTYDYEHQCRVLRSIGKVFV